MLRYFGVLSSHSKHRADVVPQPPHDDANTPPPAPGDQLELPGGDSEAAPDARPARKRWGFLLRKVFRADVDHCPLCGGPMRWLEIATAADAIARALANHGIAPRAPPPPPPTAHQQLRLPFNV